MADVEKIAAELRARIEAYPASYSSEARKLDRALLDELSRLREAERALDDLQSWVRQSRIDLQPLDPDFHPKYETLKAIGAKIRAARALSTQVEERE